MSVVAQTFAQMAQDVAPIAQYGLLGTVLGWFMYMATKMPAAIAEASEKATDRMIAEIKPLSHRMDGFSKALLIDVISRDNCRPSVQDLARQEIAKIDSRQGH